MRVILLKPSGQRLQLTWSEHSGVNKNSIHQTGVYIEVVCRQHIIIRIQTGTDSVISPTLILKNSQVDICLRAQVKVQYQKGTLHELININAAITDGIIDNLLYMQHICNVNAQSCYCGNHHGRIASCSSFSHKYQNNHTYTYNIILLDSYYSQVSNYSN